MGKSIVRWGPMTAEQHGLGHVVLHLWGHFLTCKINSTRCRVAERVERMNIYSMLIIVFWSPIKLGAEIGASLLNSIPLPPGVGVRGHFPGSLAVRCGCVIKLWGWNVRKSVLCKPLPCSVHKTFYAYGSRAVLETSCWIWRYISVYLDPRITMWSKALCCQWGMPDRDSTCARNKPL